MEGQEQQQQQQTQATAATAAVLSEEPKQADVKTGMQVVSFNRKSTSENPVKAGEKFRAVIVPQFPSFRVYSPDMGEDDVQPQEVFKNILSERFANAAGTILKDWYLKNPTATEFPVELVSFPAVVAWMQEQQTSERLNGDTIKEWAKGSGVLIRYKDQAEKAEKLTAAYVKLASNNPGLTPKQIETLTAYLGDATDKSNAVYVALQAKLVRLSTKTISDDEL